MTSSDHTDLTDPKRIWAYRPKQALSGSLTTCVSAPLSGLRFAIKDLFEVEGWPLNAGTRAPLPTAELAPSPLVKRLLELGAVAVGKTQLHEVALGITGLNAAGYTEHPTQAGHVSGGSSSGSAVAVALGQVDFALGTDTGGSIRVPAAWCGVVGYKPTKHHPAWSTAGVLPLSWTCDHAGPLAKDLATIIRVHEALTGRSVSPNVGHDIGCGTDQKAPHTPTHTPTKTEIRGLNVGVWCPPDWVTAEIQEMVWQQARYLEERGAKITEIHLPEMMDAYTPIVISEGAKVHEKALLGATVEAVEGVNGGGCSGEPSFLPFTLATLRKGAALSAIEIATAHQKRHEYLQLVKRQFRHISLLLAPAVPCLPPRFEQEEVQLLGGCMPLRRAVLRLTAPFSMLGLPALSLPALSLPAPQNTERFFAGVQWIAAHNQDDWLLHLARDLTRDIV